MADESDAETQVSFAELTGLLNRIFRRFGVSEENSDVLAANCAGCERDGSLSHGIFRIPGYVATLKSGWVDGNAVPTIEQSGPGLLRVNARNGFAQPVWMQALPQVLEMVARQGVAVAAIHDSHHFRALWQTSSHLPKAGLWRFPWYPDWLVSHLLVAERPYSEPIQSPLRHLSPAPGRSSSISRPAQCPMVTFVSRHDPVIGSR
jgi:hypothetical protein